jgi:copper chaperone CopZ
MRKLAILGLALLFLAVPATLAGEGELPEGQASAAISITGRTCGSCCKKVETAVAKLDGVVKVKADYEKNMATVVYETAKVDVVKIVDTINAETSFKAKANDETSS